MKTGRKPIRSITVTGHSLGGALAILCADDVSRQLQAQQRLDDAARQCSELLQQVLSSPAPQDVVQAIGVETAVSLDNAQKVSVEITSGRTFAASAVHAALQAARLLQEALDETDYFPDLHTAIGCPSKQRGRVENLLDLLRQARPLLRSGEPVAPVATKLRKAAANVPYRRNDVGPQRTSVTGRAPASLMPSSPKPPDQPAVNGQPQHDPSITGNAALAMTGTASDQSAAAAARDSALAHGPTCSTGEAAEADLSRSSRAALEHGPALVGVAAEHPAGVPRDDTVAQQDDDSSVQWKVQLEAAVAHCSAAAALAMVMVQFGDPVTESSRMSMGSTTVGVGQAAGSMSTQQAQRASSRSPEPPATPEKLAQERPGTREHQQENGGGSLQTNALHTGGGTGPPSLTKYLSDATVQYRSLQLQVGGTATAPGAPNRMS